MKTVAQSRNLSQLVVISSLFFCSSVGGWAWFNINPRQHEVSYLFRVNPTLAGYEFKADPVDITATEILATTNLFNGTFTRDSRERFTVFEADWLEKNAREMSVVQHTPDICWVNSGAKPLDLGQPETTEIELNGEKITFECRIYEMRGIYAPEMTLWCALASGQVITEGGRFTGDTTDQWNKLQNSAKANRSRSANTFFAAVKMRIGADGTKQFVRFSTAVQGDWRVTLVQLKEFARKWIRVEVTRSTAS